MFSRYRTVLFSLFVVAVLSLSACMGGGRAPVYSRDGQTARTVEKKPIPQRSIPGTKSTAGKPHIQVKKNHYRIVRGDTLYSIAWRYQLDYKKLAKWNEIRSPYLIKVGKNLRLTPPLNIPKPRVVATTKPKPDIKPKPPTVKPKPKIKTPDVKKVKVPTVKAKPVKPLAKVAWQWPAKGKLISSNTVSARNGIDIKGKMGQTIKAAAAGNVVYSGSGLVGYGNLIIIKHNKSFLSAYAHNSQLLVTEGASVAAGQPIAEMGNSGTNIVKLHFEIRKDGKSVNPKSYLP